MNKWPLSMIEHRRERRGKGHFQNSLHVVNILNEFALWMEEDDDGDDMTDEGRHRLPIPWRPTNFFSCNTSDSYITMGNLTKGKYC